MDLGSFERESAKRSRISRLGTIVDQYTIHAASERIVPTHWGIELWEFETDSEEGGTGGADIGNQFSTFLPPVQLSKGFISRASFNLTHTYEDYYNKTHPTFTATAPSTSLADSDNLEQIMNDYWMDMQYNASSWQRLENKDCIKKYENAFISGKRNILLVFSTKNDTFRAHIWVFGYQLCSGRKLVDMFRAGGLHNETTGGTLAGNFLIMKITALSNRINATTIEKMITISEYPQFENIDQLLHSSGLMNSLQSLS
ncbi:hypothetical protein BDZ45DRAFT_805125 [Acephala macrosclerotiorum]|nr:hypothetical protein BDZ45DRAFT_805125 [Acephala macrosclerotiorum]